MYDNDFNMEGFGAPPAMPYGEHGMNRSDTNAPQAFTGNVTVADPYPTQITPDIATGRGSATSTYGNGAMHHAMDRRGMSYGAAEDIKTFRDSAGRIYSYDPTSRAFITPGGKAIMPTDAAYPALAALYRQQTGSIVGSGTTSGWAATLEGSLGNLARGFADIPKAYAATQAYTSEAQKLAQQQAELQRQQQQGNSTGQQQVVTAGMPTWLWVVIAGGVGLVLWSVASGSKKAKE